VHTRLLKTFLAVARTRNITRASEQVHLAQSSVSDQIQSLEAELATSLFTRRREGLELTPAGEALRAYAEEILNLVGEARAAVDTAAGQAGISLSIGALETIASTALPVWLTRFRKHHPAVELQVTIAGSGDLVRKLDSGDLDIAFCFDRSPPHEGLVRRILAKEPLVLIASPGRQPAIASFVSLAAQNFVATEPGCLYRQLFDQTFADAGFAAPRLAAEVGSIQAIRRLVANGVGLALVPRLAVSDALDRGDLVELPWPGQVRTASLIATWRRGRVQPPALKLLLSAIGNATVRSADGPLRREVPSPS
jgi:DNA-binding transcriptional LysR family regulator